MWWKADFIQLTMTSSMVGPRGGSKALPKVKLAPVKGHGYCLVLCCPSDPLQLCESRRNREIWEERSANGLDALKLQHWHWPTERAQRSVTMPSCTYNQPKVDGSGYEVLPQLPYSPDSCQPTTTSWSILTNFCRENASTTRGGRKCFPRVHRILKHEVFKLEE